MSLETYQQPDDLYLSRDGDVAPLRPLFTGDVFRDLAIAGVQEGGMAVVIAHPCSMRGPEGRLGPVVLVAAVEAQGNIGANAWTHGHYDKSPLPSLEDGRAHSVRLDLIGQAATNEVVAAERIACASHFGVNLLQQRLVWYLTRLEVPTFKFNEAFSHTYEEADLLEEWHEVVVNAGESVDKSAALFEAFLRADLGGGQSLQLRLRDPQLKSGVRAACRAEARRLVTELIEKGG